MRPYIITVKRRRPFTGTHATTPPDEWHRVSRVAVATLDEQDTARALLNWRPGDTLTVRELQVIEGIERLPAEGGTVGPLPDGTVIEVARATWDDLVGPDGWNAHTTEAEVVAAFNARERQP